MKVVIDDKEYIEKEELYYEMKRLLIQDFKDMSSDEQIGAAIALQILKKLLF